MVKLILKALEIPFEVGCQRHVEVKQKKEMWQ